MTETRSVTFLRALRPSGAQNLVAIDPSTGDISAITSPDDEALQAFIDRYNGKRNLYYSVNKPKENAPNRKLSKAFIERVEYLYVDLDPGEKTRAELKETVKQIAKTKPAFIIDSGNGFNILWRVNNLSQDDAEAYARGLVDKYGGDAGVWDTARILRLPGTTNIPDRKKRERGYTVCEAKLIKQNASVTDPESIATKTARKDTAEDPTDFDWAEAQAHADIFDLPDDLRNRITEARLDDKHFAKRFDGDTEGLSDPSRSGLALAIATAMKRNGFTDQEIANTLHAHSHLYGDEWDKRQLTRAIARATGHKPSGFDLTQEQIDLIMTPKRNRPKPEGLQIIFGHEVRLSKKPSYLIKGVLQANTHAVLYGKSHTGKSFLALDMAMAIALGRPWAGRKTKQGAVVYFAAEAGRSFDVRIIGARKKYGLSESDESAPLGYCPQQLNLLSVEGTREAMLKAIEGVEAYLGQKVTLVVIDTLARVMPGGNENGSEDMGKVTDNIVWLGYHAKCATLTVHHSGKNAAAGMRGHSSLQAAIDVELECVRTGKDGTSGPGLIKTRKQREQSKDYGDVGFGLKTVDLGADEEGDAITTCYAVTEGGNEFDEIELAEMESLKAGLPKQARRMIDAYELAKDKLALINENKVTEQALLAAWMLIKDGEDSPYLSKINAILGKSSHLSGLFELSAVCPSGLFLRQYRRDRGLAADSGVVKILPDNQVVIALADSSDS